MRVVSAYLLAVLGGNESPNAADIERICKAGGVDVDPERVKTLLDEVSGKSIDDILTAGRAKLASMPAGGGAAAPAAAAAGGAAPAAAAAPAVEEKKEESEEEDMGFSLFD